MTADEAQPTSRWIHTGHHTKAQKDPPTHITIIHSIGKKINLYLFFKSLTLTCGRCGHAYATLNPLTGSSR